MSTASGYHNTPTTGCPLSSSTQHSATMKQNSDSKFKMTTLQLHRLMSLTEDAILKLKEENYSKSVLLRKRFDRLQDDLYGKPIK